MEIYIAKGKQQLGPYNIQELTQMSAIGLIKQHELFWHEGMTDWAPLACLGIFTDQDKLNSHVIAKSTPNKSNKKSSIIEYIFAVFWVIVFCGFFLLLLLALSHASSDSTTHSHSRIIYIPRIRR